MLLSMTGFSSLDIDLVDDNEKHLILSLELKTLNSRFFDVSCKLPSGLSYLETRIISLLKKKLVRGKVFLTVKVSSQGVSLEHVLPSFAIAQGYIQASEKLKHEFSLQGDLTVSDLVHLPHVFVFEKEDISHRQELQFIEKLTEATQEVTASRKQEGDALEKDLEKRFFKCEERIKEIEALALHEVDTKKKDINEVLSQANDGDDYAKMRLDELYRTLDKIDVHEEITRFKSHLQVVGKIFEDEATTSKGRKLDFILQELAREINTIAAKASSYAISSCAVDVKVELEKIREQIQNVV